MRIAIVGGGPGGLMTAYLLGRKAARTGAHHEITLFESGGRVGGKIVTRHFAAAPVLFEAGVAELYDYSPLGPDPLRRLVKGLGLPTVEMFSQTVVLGERIMRTRGDIRRHFGKKTVKAIERFRVRGSGLLTPTEFYHAGWPGDNKHVWAHRPFHAVLAGVRDEAARRYLQVAVHSDLASEPHLTDALFGLENYLMDEPHYIRLYTITGGLERLAQALLEAISAGGARVELNRPVVRVEKTSAASYRVYVRHGRQREWRDFDAVVVALPDYWLSTIEWGGRRLAAAMAKHQAYYHRPAHYLRISVLFRRPFWRDLIPDSHFQLDAFGGCCVYDESARYDAGGHGVLSWLLGGTDAMIMGNCDDDTLITQAIDSLPRSMAPGDDVFVEGHVHRWIGTVNAQPGGRPIKGAKRRHLPEPKEHPGLFVVGDYLFDSTINGALDSADIATDLLLRGRSLVSPRATWPRPLSRGSGMGQPARRARGLRRRRKGVSVVEDS